MYYEAGFANGVARFTSWAGLVEAASPDAAISIGDIANEASRNDEAQLVLDSITVCNHYAVLGNHDVAAVDQTAAKVAAVTTYGMASNYHAFDIGFAKCIVLDATYNTSDESVNQREGCLPQTQLDWLSTTLAANTQDATLIFMHFPAVHYYANDIQFNSDDLALLIDILKDYDNVWLFGGHFHSASLLKYYLLAANWCARGFVIAPTYTNKHTVLTMTRYTNGQIGATMSESSIS